MSSVHNGQVAYIRKDVAVKVEGPSLFVFWFRDTCHYGGTDEHVTVKIYPK